MEKILSIVWYKVLPAVFGGQKGIASFNQHLAEHFPLTCLCSANNQPDSTISYKLLPILPLNKWQFINPACHAKIKAIARSENTRCIILEHPYHALAAYKACKATAARLVVHSHNIESQRFKLIGKWWWRILAHYEKWIHRKADLNIFKTVQDQDYALLHFGLDPGKCMIASYGIDAPVVPERSEAIALLRKRHAVLPGEKILLFAGTLDYTPNAKAVESIYNELAPRLSKEHTAIKIIICGRNRFPAFQYLKKYTHPLVIQAGEIEDISNYFAAADVFINPAEWSGGIQTKNIDALSYHCNVVCFDNMVERETIQVASNKLFTAKTADWNSFTQQIITAINATDHTTGPSPTPPIFFETYSWKKIIANVAARITALDFSLTLKESKRT